MDKSLELIRIPLSQIKPDPKNAKDHDVGLIVESFRRFGYVNPMVLNSDDFLLAGHGRRKALLAMQGDGDPPPKNIETEADEWIVPVGIGPDFDQREGTAYRLVDNRSTEVGGYDEPQLLENLIALSKNGGLEATGYDGEDVDQLIRMYRPDLLDNRNPEPQIDRADELREKWKTESGQLWQIGKHRLICGDCTNSEIVANVMDEERAILCHADPPYGMAQDFENDNLYREKLDAFQMTWWKAIRPHLEDNASSYIWGNAEDLWRLWYAGGLRDSERLSLRNEIVWDKREDNPTMFVSGVPLENRRMYQPTERALFFMLGAQEINPNADNYWEGWEPVRSYLAEQIEILGWTPKDIQRITGVGMFSHWFTKSQWTFITEDHYLKLQEASRDYEVFKRDYEVIKRDFYSTRAHFDNTHDSMTDVWSFNRVTGEDRSEHPTPKPVDMCERAIRSSAPRAGLVLVPFAGTGPEFVACERSDRVTRGIELEPKYVAVILERMSTMGLEPKLLS